MFGISFWELLAILVVLLLFLKSEDVFKVLRKLGRLYGYLAVVSTGLMREIEAGRREGEAEYREAERREETNE